MYAYICQYIAIGAAAHLGRSSVGVVVVAGHSQASQELSPMSRWPPGMTQAAQKWAIYNCMATYEGRHQRMLTNIHFHRAPENWVQLCIVRNHRLRTAEMDSMTPVDIPRVFGHDPTLKTRRVTACWSWMNPATINYEQNLLRSENVLSLIIGLDGIWG